MVALELKGIHTYYGFSHVLHGVSMKVEMGKIVALLGRNGVGKTTTLRSIMGLAPIAEGVIIYQGQPIHHQAPHVIARLGIGYVPQGRRLFKSLTVKEHLDVFARGSGPWNREKVLELFPRLKERLKHRGNELSGGEQQMLAIARALITNPSLLIMDEPTEGLAPIVVAEVGRLIKSIRDQGYPILLTEQKLKFALDIADEVYVMSKGQIVFHGTPEELMADQETMKTHLGV
ncbi:MAG: ABC transporter ATP-binding protein [Bacillota bacterium]